jgi:hypothetical protein
MKAYITLFLLIFSGYLCSVTRTVAIDGTQQYTSIQAAVYDSGHGDVVLIYPGRYQESVTLNGCNITITSLFLSDPDPSIINDTIIDGNVNSCIRAINGAIVTINGLTLTNNENDTNVAITFSGGGVYINDYSSATISNCIIRDCIALSGGGVSVSSYSSVTISNVKIFNNQALLKGGGLSFNNSNLLTIDPAYSCEIYNNKATQGMDISVNYLSYNSVPRNITLGLGSLPLTDADGYFINVHNANVAVNIAQGAIDQIDHDLYVAPDGDDDNSGINPASPLKTIALAMQRIASNPDNPKTIHLAPGLYSHSANGQILPMGVKSNVKVQGAGMGETIIDGELSRTFWGAWYASNVEISGMKMMNGRSVYTFVLSFYYSTNIVVRDIECNNNYGSSSSGIMFGYSSNIHVENAILGNTEYLNDISGLWTFECNNFYATNIIVNGNSTTDSETNHMGMKFYDSDIHLRNSIVSNISAIDAWVFFYQSIYEPFADYNLDMSNVLIINNTISNPSWVSSPIYIQNRYQPVQINNCTIANNSSPGFVCRILAGADLRNVIFHNPGSGSELGLMNYLSVNDTAYPVSIKNSLFRTASPPSSRPELVTLTDNLMSTNPLFLGSMDSNLNVSQPEYYQLSSLSPCIDTGTPDTTGLNLPQMDLAGNWRIWNDRIDMGCYEYGSEPVGIDDPALAPSPERISISAYPNPLFNTSKAAGVFIEFTLPGKPAAEPVLDIYNVRGQKVKTMQLSESYNSLVQKAGLSGDVKQNGEFYSTVWNGKDDRNRPLASGTYIVKVRADRMLATIKITIIK